MIRAGLCGHLARAPTFLVGPHAVVPQGLKSGSDRPKDYGVTLRVRGLARLSVSIWDSKVWGQALENAEARQRKGDGVFSGEDPLVYVFPCCLSALSASLGSFRRIVWALEPLPEGTSPASGPLPFLQKLEF